ncbi:hypothetical protein F958_01800 [Acinetobacter nosocomialis NIPH 386]|uniref:Uncharacterized protein n=1 Tax=Acinetobacter nosocomialis NIPH 386 TaxID=1217985 RepID=A0AAV3IPE4_ACINO|nr:hypothetical protein F958_01800 [Acinetobacter nosocomialis NIPH 386]
MKWLEEFVQNIAIRKSSNKNNEKTATLIGVKPNKT